MHIFTVESLIQLDGSFCRYCLKDFRNPDRQSELTLEHIIPKSLVKELTARFGMMVTPDMADNVVLACESCNNAKANTFAKFYPPYRMYRSGALYWWLSHGYLKQNFVELWENLSSTYRADTLWSHGRVSKRAKQLFLPFTNLQALLEDYNPNGWKLSPLFQAYDFEFPADFNPIEFYIQNNVQPQGTAYQAVRGTSYAGQAGTGGRDVYGKVELTVRTSDYKRVKVYPNTYGTYHTINSLDQTSSWVEGVKNKLNQHNKVQGVLGKQVHDAGIAAKKSHDKFTSTTARIKAMEQELKALSAQVGELADQSKADKKHLDSLKDNQNFLKNNPLDLHDVRWNGRNVRDGFDDLISGFTGVIEEDIEVATEVTECAEEVAVEATETAQGLTADSDGYIRDLSPLEALAVSTESQWVPAPVQGEVIDVVEVVAKPSNPTTQGTTQSPKRKRKVKIGLGKGTKKDSIKLRKGKGARGTYLSQYERQMVGVEEELNSWKDELYAPEEDLGSMEVDIDEDLGTMEEVVDEDYVTPTEEPQPLTNNLGDLLKGLKLT